MRIVSAAAPTQERSKRSNEAPRNGKICPPCMIRGARAAKRAPSRQDLRAVYSQTAVCRAFRTHGARILPKPAHFGCMAAISCHEPALFPPEAPSGTHRGDILPWLTARERTAAIPCHCWQPGNAPRRYPATAGPFQECLSKASCREGPRLPGLAAAGVGSTRAKRTAARTTTKQSTRRLETQPRAPPQRFSLQQQAGIATKSQWCHEVGRRQPNETPTNSTTHANTSKKP